MSFEFALIIRFPRLRRSFGGRAFRFLVFIFDDLPNFRLFACLPRRFYAFLLINYGAGWSVMSVRFRRNNYSFNEDSFFCFSMVIIWEV